MCGSGLVFLFLLPHGEKTDVPMMGQNLSCSVRACSQAYKLDLLLHIHMICIMYNRMFCMI